MTVSAPNFEKILNFFDRAHVGTERAAFFFNKRAVISERARKIINKIVNLFNKSAVLAENALRSAFSSTNVP